eukprot:CAMPEP_0180813276 /NCGR_PEP_ID=MMETSP1038_2-20121128/66451_1 /TAXON_ID=632150 /ORGANISM="Azadinium spinosum, Strain 3D9" /LENGTH=197 /DNA_ID=CAMNT_0022854861 /DNA_START=16 /DNA_END=606 /DNA_ORIENTATION=+
MSCANRGGVRNSGPTSKLVAAGSLSSDHRAQPSAGPRSEKLTSAQVAVDDRALSSAAPMGEASVESGEREIRIAETEQATDSREPCEDEEDRALTSTPPTGEMSVESGEHDMRSVAADSMESEEDEEGRTSVVSESDVLDGASLAEPSLLSVRSSPSSVLSAHSEASEGGADSILLREAQLEVLSLAPTAWRNLMSK